ncbi:CDGSH iron-sulfur domain-containing protein [Cyanobium sp. Morenito 9A2]|uniref:CDGSH iron-sulfur domain-containing protein n=1 Tax=Cyanobium sp. Morenito 9A2 TaxID=2823718 RepID=UPI0020CD404C|nr:CDGSH iron-sulfur domain-containing protein [Cyanobium sp. Morenito 9A2]MCP9850815.1 CDGSH iron-sulfur domain-containing protein [Cyanobium sp. Morenito 9A2]
MNEPDDAASGPQPLELPAGLTFLCRCGRSRQGWFCDGAHLGTGQLAREVLLAAPGTVQVCGCGRSRHYPLCDGSHGRAVVKRWWMGWRWGPRAAPAPTPEHP